MGKSRGPVNVVPQFNPKYQQGGGLPMVGGGGERTNQSLMNLIATMMANQGASRGGAPRSNYTGSFAQQVGAAFEQRSARQERKEAQEREFTFRGEESALERDARREDIGVANEFTLEREERQRAFDESQTKTQAQHNLDLQTLVGESARDLEDQRAFNVSTENKTTREDIAAQETLRYQRERASALSTTAIQNFSTFTSSMVQAQTLGVQFSPDETAAFANYTQEMKGFMGGMASPQVSPELSSGVLRYLGDPENPGELRLGTSMPEGEQAQRDLYDPDWFVSMDRRPTVDGKPLGSPQMYSVGTMFAGLLEGIRLQGIVAAKIPSAQRDLLQKVVQLRERVGESRRAINTNLYAMTGGSNIEERYAIRGAVKDVVPKVLFGQIDPREAFLTSLEASGGVGMANAYRDALDRADRRQKDPGKEDKAAWTPNLVDPALVEAMTIFMAEFDLALDGYVNGRGEIILPSLLKGGDEIHISGAERYPQGELISQYDALFPDSHLTKAELKRISESTQVQTNIGSFRRLLATDRSVFKTSPSGSARLLADEIFGATDTLLTTAQEGPMTPGIISEAFNLIQRSPTLQETQAWVNGTVHLPEPQGKSQAPGASGMNQEISPPGTRPENPTFREMRDWEQWGSSPRPAQQGTTGVPPRSGSTGGVTYPQAPSEETREETLKRLGGGLFSIKDAIAYDEGRLEDIGKRR